MLKNQKKSVEKKKEVFFKKKFRPIRAEVIFFSPFYFF